MLIKVGDGGDPEYFNTIGGLRLSSMQLNTQLLDASHVASGQWRLLLGDAGIRYVMISGGGRFTDSNAEETVRGYAFASSVNNYQFIFANGDRLSGPFQTASYERSGHYDTEETYVLTLESAGSILFTAA